MPPRPPANSNRQPRRRPGPVMPGGWVWLVLLVGVVGMLIMLGYDTYPRIDYSEFSTLLEGHRLDNVTLIGTERIVGEVKEGQKAELPEGLRNKLGRGNKFSVDRPSNDN